MHVTSSARAVLGVGALIVALAVEATAQDGEAAFRANCASCHDTAAGTQAANVPTVEALRRFTPGAILNSLLAGKAHVSGDAREDGLLQGRETGALDLAGRIVVQIGKAHV